MAIGKWSQLLATGRPECSHNTAVCIPESNPRESKANLLLKTAFWDFSDGPVFKNLTSNVGGMGSIPDWRTKIPHATDN